jgi:DNA-binding SARP family transcriptional activator
MSSAERRDLLALLLEINAQATPADTVPIHLDGQRERVPELRFELLGPLVVRYRGVDVSPSAPKMRTVLTSLLCNANKPVAPAMLYRDLWEDTPPRSAQCTLQTYIFNLRKLFRTKLGLPAEYVNQELLLTHTSGYTLRVEPDQLDVHEFDTLLAAGSTALHNGDYARAAVSLRQALALWRGPLVHDPTWGTQLRAQMAGLDERRFYAYVMRIEADLCLGRHRETVSELASLVVEYPLHESVHAMFMIALHRSGRTSAALDTFLHFRKRMLDELGLEPSARIQALHLAVLSADPVLGDRNLTSDMLLDLLMVTA